MNKPDASRSEHEPAQRIVVVTDADAADDRIDLGALGRAVRRQFVLIGVCALVVAVLAAARAFLVTPQYRSDAMVAVASSQQGGLNGLLGGQVGVLASMVGVDIGGGDAKRGEYVALLSSRNLTREFIEKHDLMPQLFADQWQPQSRTYRTSRWSPTPTLNRGINLWLKESLKVVEDKKSGLIRVTVNWPDRKEAAALANDLVAMANEHTRGKAIDEARRSIEFLQQEMERTTNVQARAGIASLLQMNLNQVTLASAQREYALRTVDAATVADEGAYASPRTMLEIAVGLVLGAFIGMAVAAARTRPEWLRRGRERAA